MSIAIVPRTLQFSRMGGPNQAGTRSQRRASPEQNEVGSARTAETDRDAANRLLQTLYTALRREARRRMAAERADHTFSATALVHEAYLKLCGPRDRQWQNRAHFYAAAVEAMRQVLLDHAKSRKRRKRGGGARRIGLDAVELAVRSEPTDFLSLDEAICRLTQQAPEMGEVTRMRFYAGLSIEETAAALKLSPATVKRRWEFARTWLFKELGHLREGGSDA